jgi:nitroreductase
MDPLRDLRVRNHADGFTLEPVSRDALLTILRAGTVACTGLNSRPWRFVLVQQPAVRAALARLAPSVPAVAEATAFVVVFADFRVMEHFTLDYQAVGACLQNMLLAASALELGAAWVGGFLNRAEEVRLLLEMPDCLELMAVVAVGHPCRKRRRSNLRPLEEVLLRET